MVIGFFRKSDCNEVKKLALRSPCALSPVLRASDTSIPAVTCSSAGGPPDQIMSTAFTASPLIPSNARAPSRAIRCSEWSAKLRFTQEVGGRLVLVVAGQAAVAAWAAFLLGFLAGFLTAG